MEGIAIRNQVYSCNSRELIKEEAEHRKYGVEADFCIEGIRLTKLSRYFITSNNDGNNRSLLVSNAEINPLLLVFRLWEKHHNSLSGSLAYGHSWSGWISTDYFEPYTDKPAFTEYNPKSPVPSVREKSKGNNQQRVEEWKKEAERADAELNEKLRNRLSTASLEARIRRFELELCCKNTNTRALLTENDIKAIKDFVPLYRKRRKNYR